MPTIAIGASIGPKLGTGPLNQSACASRFAARKAARRGQSGQSCGGASRSIRTSDIGAVSRVVSRLMWHSSYGRPILAGGLRSRTRALKEPCMILVAFGANLPAPDGAPPHETCARAIRAVAALPGITLEAVSRFWETAPVPVSDQPPYING